MRDFVLTLIDRDLSPATTNSTLCALSFLYVETMGLPDRVAGVRNRKLPARLPRAMAEQEVERLILATPDLQHRAAFVTACGADLRVSETVTVKIGDIKADRKCLHIPSGKGGTERMAPLRRDNPKDCRAAAGTCRHGTTTGTEPPGRPASATPRAAG